jgi:hypothetical protein
MVKYLLVICSLFAMSVSVFGQDKLENDLKKSFKNYDLVKLDNEAVLEKAKSDQPIAIQAYGRYFEFVLIPNDIRARNYKAVESSESGDRELPRSEVVTFKGKLRDDFASEVRVSVTENGIEGLIYTSDNKKYFVTKAERFSKHARKDDAVVFSEDDLVQTVDLSNDAVALPDDVEAKRDSSFEILKSYIFGSSEKSETHGTETAESSAALMADLRVLEIATEADYQWVTQAGGAAQANSEILSILNLVDGIYKRDLNLTISVVYQHAWSVPDPYSAAPTMSEQLNLFRNYWNTTPPYSQQPRDTAHLFTNKFNNQGLAYIGEVCRGTSYAYGITGKSGSMTHLITAHEIGHNLNAAHVDNSGSCTNSIMISFLNPSVTSFCDISKSQISSYVATYGACLTAGGPTPTPTPTPPLTYSISGNVYYGTPSANQAKPVPNVLLSVTGPTSPYTYTDTTGSYTIRDLTAGGYYTVTPYKTGGVNGISTFDATLVLRHVAANGQGANALNANQRIAADANGDGNISTFDATVILRYVAANGANANTGQVGTWKFVPPQRTYFPLLSSQTNQNYEAILVGEINGTWTPSG